MSRSPLAFETLRKALAGSLIGNIIQVISLMVSSVVLARLLGPTGLGIVAIVSAAVRMAVIPALEGANRLCERELAGAIGKNDGQQARTALRFTFLASCVICLVGAVAIYMLLAASTIKEQGSQAVSILAAAVSLVVTNIALAAIRSVLRGEGQTTWAINIANLTTLSIPLFYLVWWVLFEDLTAAIALWIQVATKIMLLPLVIWLARRYWALVPKTEPGAAPMAIPRGWLWESGQFTLLGIITVALAEMGTLFIGYLGTSEEAGFFRIASRVFLLTNFAATAAQQAYGPQIARTWQSGNRTGLESPSRMISVLALCSALVLFVIFALFGKSLIVLAFGAPFEKAYMPALIMSFGGLLTSFTAAAPRLLKMTGEQKIVLFGSVLGLAAAVVLNYLLIPSLGAVGCAISFACAIILAQIVHAFGVKRCLGFFPVPNREAIRALAKRLRNLPNKRN